MINVLLVQRIIPEYRVKFFDNLHALCLEDGINVTIIYGQEEECSVPKSVLYERAWSKRVKNQYFKLGRVSLVWQPCFLDMLQADLIICEQANRLSTTYITLILRLFGKKSALWGHGRNLQAKKAGLNFKEMLKQKMLSFSDFFFAYTDSARKYLIDAGYNSNKIKSVRNSIDVQSLVERLESIKLNDNLSSYKVFSASNTVIYCGGLYADKKVDFLLETAKIIRDSIDNFKLIVIGSGPDEDLVRKFSYEYSWVEYLGARQSIESISYFMESKYMLMPAAVGLVVLDSFALETPIITTDISNHGPEFSYIENGFNGVVTPYDVESYASKIIHLLRDEEALNSLVAGAKISSTQYSVENMAKNFCDGIKQVLCDKIASENPR